MAAPLAVGFDYGTSHCSIGTLGVGEADVQLAPLEGGNPLIPSTIFMGDRSFVFDFVRSNIANDNDRHQYAHDYARILKRANHAKPDWQSSCDESLVSFGRAAFSRYSAEPAEGHYIRSPKSFLGSVGMSAEQLNFVEQVVAAMMQRFKATAEAAWQRVIDRAVIGRPVNFQGLGGEKSNNQAIEILTRAAHRAGLKDVEFLYEPLAAGIDFESRLNEDKNVLIVDVGGGTTDCSMVRMGPSYREKADRMHDCLAHAGERIGGNDFDVRLSFYELMPLLGSRSLLKSGKPMPTHPFWIAVETNNAGSARLSITQLPDYSLKNTSV